MARTAAPSHHRRTHGSRARHSWSRNREWLRRSQVVAHRAPRSDAVDRSSPAAVPDAASAAREVASSFSRLRKTPPSSKLQDTNAGSPSLHSRPRPLTDWHATFRGYCDAAANDARTARVCTRKHLVLASHKLLCQTCFAKAARTAGKRGRERQWTLGQALRCSLHFLPSSY